MKLVTYLSGDEERLGLYHEGKIFDMKGSALMLGVSLPSNIMELLEGELNIPERAKYLNDAIVAGKVDTYFNANDVKVLAPLPHPNSCRDGYAFRQHVETARRNRGAAMIPEFDQFPVFYFTNHNTVFGEGDIVVEEDHLNKLDFELESAVVIGRKGKNIKAEDADLYIAGYMIMNDLSARFLQAEEMKLNLGPAKGKDFATITGPWLVSKDELEKYKIKTPAGDKYDLRMTAYHNGNLISDGNMKDMNWTFAEIIERASYGVDLYPGDVIGSGTVGTGCYLELNGTHALEAKARGEEFVPVWLKEGDTIELEITGLGRLKNRIVRSANKYSILNKKI
jgi:fumarylacetoacetate (FAA) hydrolase